ncbi:acyl-CoA desaturase (plasmid) [Thalassospira marina]|uniref:Acyl-CoA desaturase n=2 Tax=Thalassospira marina TaxID=2048283 RepID=A0A2N3KTT9_9PROT|nr:acyl-CoA desaturase [Thalassospira marina]PKR53965.1 acyl-CoA desaturase [Thalassospira marina]
MDDVACQLFSENNPTDGPRKKVIDSPYLNKFQRIHFILFDVAPAIGAVATVVVSLTYKVTSLDLVLFAVMWLFSGLGISVGYHRLFTHRTFQASPTVRALLGIFGSMAGQGGVISWTAMHRRHHECGDQEGDLHSPNLSGPGWKGWIKGFVHAHFTWMYAHSYPNVSHYAPDLLKDRVIVWVNRRYYTWIVLGLLIPTVIGGLYSQTWMGALTGFLWGGAMRMFVVEQGIFSLNSLCHLIGKRRFKTHDQSTNIAWLSPFIFGESWHHNHHAFPGSASFGLAWYRIDPGYWFICLLSVLGQAWDIKIPTREQIQRRELPKAQASTRP